MDNLDTSYIGVPIQTSFSEDEAPYVLERTRLAFQTRKFQLINSLVPPENKTEEDRHILRAALVEAGIPIDPKKTEVNETVRRWIEETLWNHTSELVEDIPRMRNYVKTRLFIESNGEKASDRIKALEDMGKLSEMGLFSDRVEVSIENKSVEELRQELNERLAKYMGKVEHVKTEKKLNKQSMIIDLNKELGLDKDESSE